MLVFFKKLFFCLAINLLILSQLIAQEKLKPTWWFGISSAANLNSFGGTTQKLTSSLTVPTQFNKGFSVRPYGSFFVEYQFPSKLSGMLKISYDNRSGSFNSVMAPCDCPATLRTVNNYISIEPTFHFAPSTTGMYIFAGPALSFNIENAFTYTELKKEDVHAKLTDMNPSLFSAFVGIGYNMNMQSFFKTKTNFSPFISFHPYLGQKFRSIESWSASTIRTGLAIKFGKLLIAPIDEPQLTAMPNISFSVRPPKALVVRRTVSETVPLRNSIFFNLGSIEIPKRYTVLTQSEASNFKEDQLFNENSEGSSNRSAKQLKVYYNILNILGDRMRTYPDSKIALNGSSSKGEQEGKKMAESVKKYLINSFGIKTSMITTTGSVKPAVPTELIGATKDLDLVYAEDNRVDIESTSPELLLEVGGAMMKSVQIIDKTEDPLHGHVIFNIKSAEDLLSLWNIEITDDQGKAQNFGPFTKDQASVSAKVILAGRLDGMFKVVMKGETKSGLSIERNESVYLSPQTEVIEKGYRHSILFDFDNSKTVDIYEKFLQKVVAPLIEEKGTVHIHGHTDVLGDDLYNQTLAEKRAWDVQNILKWALFNAGKNEIKFNVTGFGEDPDKAPFENLLPEERFYNRTVIIDIIPPNNNMKGK